MQSAQFLTSPEWADDQKASVLFAPFREKSLNPNSWERKMNFWTAALLECAQLQNDLIVDLKTLTNCFERRGKYPKCLEAVTKEMVRAGKLKTVSEFERQSSSWVSWGVDTFLRRPLSWGLTKVIASGSADGDLFIVPDLLKKKSSEILAHHYQEVQHEATDNVMELSAFRAQCHSLLKSEAECDVVQKQLELDRKLLVSKTKEGTLIVKICNQSESRVQPVLEIELNIFRIRKVMKCLEQQMEALSLQSDNCTAEARKLVKEQKKALALHQLRRRRTTQSQIEKKSSCLNTLHDIIQRIEDSTSNEMVLKAYESGVSAIRQLTGDMTVEKVDRVLDDLQQVLEEQEEITETMAGVSLPGSEVNAEALEMELNSLLAEGGEHGDTSLAAQHSDSRIDDLVTSLAEHSLEDLPDVPTSSPGSRSAGTSPAKDLQRAPLAS